MNRIADIRLRIQCGNFREHAKILPIGSFIRGASESVFGLEDERMDRDLKIYFARRIGEIICGNSGMYIYRPAARSPIGKCALCKGQLSFEIQEWDGQKLISQTKDTDLAEAK
jgi:hypothetical protein